MVAIFKSDAAAAEIHARYREILAQWPVASTQSRVPTRQGETFVVACGAEDAPALVLLHGSMSLAATWMSDAAAWSARFRVYAVDMIGEAGLSAPSRPPLASEAYALWLDDVMQGLGLTRAAFVGASLGGWLALDYAVRRPERVERIAALCPAGIGRQKFFVLRAALSMWLGPWAVGLIRRMVFGPPPADLPPTGRALMSLFDTIRRAFRPRMERIPILSDEALRGLTSPLLVIAGGRDMTIDSNDTRRRLAHNIPGADVLFLPRTHHYIPGQAEVIFRFLGKEG